MSAMMRLQRCYPGRGKKLRDITMRGGLSAMTGMDLWQLASFMLFLFRGGLTNTAAMVTSRERVYISLFWDFIAVGGRGIVMFCLPSIHRATWT